MYTQHTTESNSPNNQFYDQSITNDEAWKMFELNNGSAEFELNNGSAEHEDHGSMQSIRGGNLFDTGNDKKLNENTIGSYQKQKLSASFLEENKLQLVIPPRDENDFNSNITNFTSPSLKLPTLPNTPTTPNSALIRHLPPSQPRSLLQGHFKTSSFSNVVSQQSTALKTKPQSTDNYKKLSETNTSVRYSPSQNRSPSNHSPSLNTFILPPFVDRTNFSVSTCNLLPQPFVSSSYSRSQNISSPNVESPSLLYSNASMIKPFTFHFIKQKSKDSCPNSSLYNSNNEEIQRLEFIYKKRSELLASQLLIPKMEQFFRGLVSQVQELLLSSVQIKTEENEMKRLDQIQHLLYLKKFLFNYISDLEKFTTFLNSPNMKSSNDDLKYLEDIEKTLNYFKNFKTGEDMKYQNWKGNGNEFFQFLTQLSASFCICCGKPLPLFLQKCISFFPVNQLNTDELIKRVKYEDQKTLNSNKFLTFTNNFTQIKKETYDIEAPEVFQDFSNSDFFEYD